MVFPKMKSISMSGCGRALLSSMIVPLAYFAVSFLSSYKIDRSVTGGHAFPDEWRIASVAVFSILSMATLLFFSVKSASEFLKNRYIVKLCLYVAIILAGSCFAYIALGYRSSDISIWVRAFCVESSRGDHGG